MAGSILAGLTLDATTAAGNAKLDTLHADLAKGQQVMSASIPVVLASDQAVPTLLPDINFTGQSAQTALVNNILTPTAGTTAFDLTGYHSGSVQVVSTATSGAYIFEGSNDNVSWTSVPVINPLTASGLPTSTFITATASTIIYTFPLNVRFLRLRISTALTGGSVQAFSKFSQTPFTPSTFNVAQATAASLQVYQSQFTPANSLVDSFSNPATANLGADSMLFNGSTWDRQRANFNTNTGDSGAKTASFGGAALTNFNSRGAVITCTVSAVSGTSPTMALQLQWSPDAGTTWYNYGPATANLTAAGQVMILIYPTVSADVTTPGSPAALTFGIANAKVINAPLPRTWRVGYVIGGTTPSFTITSTTVNYVS